MGDPTRPVALWRDRTFRFIWGGQTASLFGDQVTNLALPWLLLHQTHSAVAAGAVSAARYLPLLTFGLAAGLIADRIERRALMIGADVGRLVALGAVALVGVLGRVPPLWLLVLVVLVLGTGQLLFGVAYGAWLPDVTGDERLGQANAALESSDAASVLAGGPLGGALITAVGPVLALGADALSYGVSAVTLTRVRTERPVGQAPLGNATGNARTSGVWAEATAGVRAILALPAQRLIKGAATALHMDAGAIGVLLATLNATSLAPASLASRAGVRGGGRGRADRKRGRAAPLRPWVATGRGGRAGHRCPWERGAGRGQPPRPGARVRRRARCERGAGRGRGVGLRPGDDGEHARHAARAAGTGQRGEYDLRVAGAWGRGRRPGGARRDGRSAPRLCGAGRVLRLCRNRDQSCTSGCGWHVVSAGHNAVTGGLCASSS